MILIISHIDLLLQQPYKIGIINITILHMRKLKYEEAKLSKVIQMVRIRFGI